MKGVKKDDFAETVFSKSILVIFFRLNNKAAKLKVNGFFLS